jgi:hypothetical protein
MIVNTSITISGLYEMRLKRSLRLSSNPIVPRIPGGSKPKFLE